MWLGHGFGCETRDKAKVPSANAFDCLWSFPVPGFPKSFTETTAAVVYKHRPVRSHAAAPPTESNGRPHGGVVLFAIATRTFTLYLFK